MSSIEEIMAEMLEVSKAPEAVQGKPFDKATWAEQKKAERQKLFTWIDAMAARVGGSETVLKTYLDVQSRFNRYSVGNALLIAMQCAGATQIKEFEKWKEEGYVIKRNESALLILGPGKEYQKKDGSVGVSYEVKKVFDVSQTTAENAILPKVNWDERLILRSLLTHAPCEVKADTGVIFPEGSSAVYDPRAKTIFVAKECGSGDLIKDMARELAHAYMDPGIEYDREANQYKAHCVSYMVCKRYGLDVSEYGFGEAADHLAEKDAGAVRAELNEIREVFNKLESDMRRVLDQKKDPKGRDEAR